MTPGMKPSTTVKVTVRPRAVMRGAGMRTGRVSTPSSTGLKNISLMIER